jgi:hypothetical protein
MSALPLVQTAIMVANLLWFGVAFWYFSLKPVTAAKLLVPPSARGSPLFQTVSASVRFLGGMNFAFALFAALLLGFGGLFPQPRQHALFAVVFSVAHASQFAFNVPVALGGGRQGESFWPVLKGPMLGIFMIDLTLMLANAAVAVALLAAA